MLCYGMLWYAVCTVHYRHILPQTSMIQSINTRELICKFRKQLDENGIDQHVHQALENVRIVKKGVDLLKQLLVLDPNTNQTWSLKE